MKHLFFEWTLEKILGDNPIDGRGPLLQNELKQAANQWHTSKQNQSDIGALADEFERHYKHNLERTGLPYNHFIQCLHRLTLDPTLNDRYPTIMHWINECINEG